jgi:carboxyl-terminal processing protease
MNLTDAVKKLRGAAGEAVNITVLRESEGKLLEFKIIRDIIKIKDIKEVRILEDGIAYIRLTEFRENTAREFGAELGRLKKEGMKALILDLRNNPGGLMDNAVKVAEMFLGKDKLVVYTKSRDASQDLQFTTKVDGLVTDIPLAVVINEGSASGSEIVAAALRDHKRAIIVGAKSFGKGSVQTIIPLDDGSALKLTTSRYFSPLGKTIHEQGIMPDIVVEDGIMQEDTAEDKEEALNPDKVFEKFVTKQIQKDPLVPKPFDYKADRQITAALDALKAILIYKAT